MIKHIIFFAISALVLVFAYLVVPIWLCYSNTTPPPYCSILDKNILYGAFLILLFVFMYPSLIKLTYERIKSFINKNIYDKTQNALENLHSKHLDLRTFGINRLVDIALETKNVQEYCNYLNLHICNHSNWKYDDITNLRIPNNDVLTAIEAFVSLGCCSLKYSNNKRLDLSNADLSGINFKSVKLLENIDFSMSNLSRVDFTETRFENVIFNKTILKHSVFKGSVFHNVRGVNVCFDNSDLRNLYAYGPGYFYKSSFKNADLSFGRERKNILNRLFKKKLNTKQYTWFQVPLCYCDFTNANLARAKFTAANITGANFENAVAPETGEEMTIFKGAGYYPANKSLKLPKGVSPNNLIIKELKDDVCMDLENRGIKPSNDSESGA